MNAMVASYAAALVLGATHALEVDHMVAMNAFLGNRPRVGTAVLFGVRWALAHAAVVLVLGGVLAALGVAVPSALSNWAEVGVGVMLVGLGLWAARASGLLHLHGPASHGGHAHLHAHGSGWRPQHRPHPHGHEFVNPANRHRHLPAVVGATHGLAGTAPVVALMPVTLADGVWSAVGYLLVFGAGTVVSMGLYAGLAAAALGRVNFSLRAARLVAAVTASASVAIGLWWIARGLFG